MHCVGFCGHLTTNKFINIEKSYTYGELKLVEGTDRKTRAITDLNRAKFYGNQSNVIQSNG